MFKQKLKKIREGLYELPKGTKQGMRVPAWLFLSEKLLQDVEEGAVEQIANVATLPGIYKHSIALPDMHFGYGFPIGGVAALDYENGGLSPGGIGFDINCLSGDSKILHEHGFTKQIKDFEKDWASQRIRCVNPTEKIKNTEIGAFMKFKPRNKVFRIKTLSGRTIIATEDHPFLTPEGMIPLKDLKGPISVYPFDGVEYEEPEDFVIVSREDIENLPLKKNKTQTIRELERRGLLPLRSTNKKLPYLLKLMGFIFGDGALMFIKNKGIVWFYGEPEDLERIREDVRSIGFTPSKIYSRRRDHRIDTAYSSVEFSRTEYSFKTTASSFAALLMALGVPVGNKVTQAYKVPHWIFKCAKWQKRLFLAALFGAELSSPATVTTHGYNFYGPVLSMNKNDRLVESGMKFLKQLAALLKEFGVKSRIIKNRKEYEKDGRISIKLRLQISSKPDNLIKLWSKIGYEYNKKKTFLANAAVQYLRIKEKVIQERKYVAEQATQLKKEGSSLSQVCQYLNSNYVNFRFIERSVYRGRKSSPRISFSFPVFEEYLKEATKNLGETGQVWDEIVLKEEVDYKDYVYDFTVLDENHNFIANSFVVSNCGVRVLRTNLKEDEIRPKMRSLVDTIFRNVPSGVGSKGRVKLSWGQLEEAIEIGARWAVENGYGTEKDLEHLEEKGSLPGKASVVSEKAKKRGMPQLGSLGAGNHFLEIQRVDGIFDKDAARVMGIEEEGQICVMIHTGSRGFGHQVCTDYLKILESKFRDIIAKLPDRELVYAPANTKECENYFYAMNSAANFAWCNRQMITHWVRESITSALGIKEEDVGLEVIYDVAHNIGKVEEHKVNGEVKKVYVHRKGATRAFGPGSPDIPKDYKKIGQPVLIPGSMGTSSYILIGTERAEEETFSSVCHGAGRLQSRAKALKKFRGEQVKRSLEGEGITVRSASWKVLAEEAPPVYKDVDEVVKTCEVAGICKIVVRLKPIGVVKG